MQVVRRSRSHLAQAGVCPLQVRPASPPRLQIIPSPGPAEAPPRSIPTEVPAPSAPPEFTPGTPTELPQRGGSEISFPGSEVNFP